MRTIPCRHSPNVAVAQNQWGRRSTGAPPILVYFSGGKTGILAHGRAVWRHRTPAPPARPPLLRWPLPRPWLRPGRGQPRPRRRRRRPRGTRARWMGPARRGRAPTRSSGIRTSGNGPRRGRSNVWLVLVNLVTFWGGFLVQAWPPASKGNVRE